MFYREGLILYWETPIPKADEKKKKRKYRRRPYDGPIRHQYVMYKRILYLLTKREVKLIIRSYNG